MKTIIAGSRDNIQRRDVYRAIALSGWARMITEVVSGGCPGEYSTDMHGEHWSRNVLGKEPTVFPYIRALGKAGGPARNKQMAEYVAAGGCGYLLAVPYDLRESKGTASMIRIALMYQLRIFVYEVKSGKYWYHGLKGHVYGQGVDVRDHQDAQELPVPDEDEVEPIMAFVSEGVGSHGRAGAQLHIDVPADADEVLDLGELFI